MVVDHIDHNTLNNRRSNLRVCRQCDNAKNRMPTKGRSLPKGVYRKRSEGCFEASIQCNGKLKSLGRFQRVRDAAIARERAEQEMYGSFSYSSEGA